MVPLFNYILRILLQSRFSSHFSQPPHTTNILDDANKIQKKERISQSLTFVPRVLFSFLHFIKERFFTQHITRHFFLYPLSSSSQDKKYPFWISLSSPSINDHSRITHIQESHTSIPNTKKKHLKKYFLEDKETKTWSFEKIREIHLQTLF